MTTADAITGDARLAILTELARISDGRSNEVVLGRVLDAHGYRRSAAWLRTQLRALAEVDAIRIEELGDVMIAGIRADGRAHVERRIVIEGVSRPADRD